MHLSQKLIRYLVLAGLGIIAISCTATSPNINIGGIPLDKNYPFQEQVLSSYIEGDSLLTAEAHAITGPVILATPLITAQLSL